uniref:Uncharacterized protein n=1 Tax=Ectopseudomonas mendocina (strain ymp) TaxID=399739 RepID=A4XV00_ECTM1
MPGTYVVQDRNAGHGRAGLALPFPPTAGPLVIREKNDLRYLQMSQPWCGDVADEAYAGCFTEGISDCSVVAVMEWEPQRNGWGRCYFEHLAGSAITSHSMQLASHVLRRVRGPRFAVVAQYYGGIAFSEADSLFDELRVPPQNRSYYQSGRRGMNFGLRFFGGYFGEHLPGNQ